MKIMLHKSLALAVLASPFTARAAEESTPAAPPAPATMKLTVNSPEGPPTEITMKLGACSPAAAPAPATAKLAVGSPAPAFKPEKWIQGDPVTTFEKDKTYLIECWATWCGPCVAAIPHVNELHEKFKDKGLVVIGMNVWEDSASEAEAFVKAKGKGMAYRVAYDGGKSGAFSRDWLIAAGQTGIPHAFIIRDNKLYWQGHPSQLTEDTVSAMIGGTFDAQKAASAAADQESLIREIVTTKSEFDALIAAKKPDEAAAKLARAIELAPRLGAPPEAIAVMKSEGQAKIAMARGNAEEAVAILKRNVPAEGLEARSAAAVWYQAAHAMITTPGLGKARDYAFALDCIGKSIAADPSLEGEAGVRLLKARALYATDKKDESLQLVENAAEHGILESLSEEHKAIREALKAGKPWPEGEMNPDHQTP